MSTTTITKTEYKNLLDMQERLYSQFQSFKNYVLKRFEEKNQESDDVIILKNPKEIEEYLDIVSDKWEVKESKIKQWEEASKRMDRGEGEVFEDMDSFRKYLKEL